MPVCELCTRAVPFTTKHHLIPRTLHKNKWFRKKFDRTDLHKTVNLCKTCHREIHRQIPEKEMGRHFNTLSLLHDHPKVKNFVNWIQSR